MTLAAFAYHKTGRRPAWTTAIPGSGNAETRSPTSNRGCARAVGYRESRRRPSRKSSRRVGRAVASSGISRAELFVTTKLWIQRQTGEKSARQAFEASLQRLGLDHVDLYLTHQPLGDYYSAWRAMQDINRDGLAKAIGVANFYPDRLVDLVEHNESVIVIPKSVRLSASARTSTSSTSSSRMSR